MDKVIAYLLVLMLVVQLAVPAQAAREYNLLYDATEQLDQNIGWEIGTKSLQTLSDTHKTQVRIDIVTDTEGYSLAEYGELFYLSFDYGYETTRDCILLMLHMSIDNDGLAFTDYAFYCGGKSRAQLEKFPAWAAAQLEEFLTADAWAGDRNADNQTFQCLADAYISRADAFLSEEQPPVVTESVIPAYTYILDDIGLLAEEDRMQLEAQAAALSLTHNMVIHVAIIENFANDGSKTVEQAAENYCQQRGLTEQDGILLLISAAEGDYTILPRGIASQWLSEEQIGALSDILLDKFAAGMPAEGMEAYLRHCDIILSGDPAPEAETQVEKQPESEGSGLYVPIVLVLCALLILLILREKLLTLRKKKVQS